MNNENVNGTTGRVFSIQRFSLQDGPGIRTTVFLKGCPLRCLWCSNPESQHPYPEVMFRRQNCRSCGTCAETCPRGAVSFEDDFPRINRDPCDRCMSCVETCPSGALYIAGARMTADEVAEEACRDEIFYTNSGGGVTLSGGEPLAQPAFARDVLKRCRERSVHTALDTSGCTAWDALDSVLAYTDLILFDLKHLDPERHTQGTGVGNELILDNLKRILDEGEPRVWIRIPVIPGYNDGEDLFREMASFLHGRAFEKVSLLGYHQWGRSKYEALGLDYPLGDRGVASREHVERLGDILRAVGIPVSVDH